MKWARALTWFGPGKYTRPNPTWDCAPVDQHVRCMTANTDAVAKSVLMGVRVHMTCVIWLGWPGAPGETGRVQHDILSIIRAVSCEFILSNH